MNPRRLVIVAAGGTGGHLFPAQALAEVLVARGFRVRLMTDERVRDYGKSFPAEQVHVIPSASLSLSDLATVPARMMRLFRGYRQARTLIRDLKPVAVVGFGGYPSLPPLFAARSLKVPTAVHEQNAVLGRANKLLARRCNAVATSFADVKGMPQGARVTLTGNPVRRIALAARAVAYPDPQRFGAFPLVVFGGSQGAKFFSDFMPQVFEAMDASQRKRLRLTQQCRAEDLPFVRATYQRLGVQAELSPFFNDMPSIISKAQLVICRSGASSIAELGVIGRPAALVPLPHAIDNDQLRNAESFAKAGAGWVYPQKELAAGAFAGFLAKLMNDGPALRQAAAAALSHGKPDAAERLADLVEQVASRGIKSGVRDA